MLTCGSAARRKCANLRAAKQTATAGSDYNPQRNPNDGEGAGDSLNPNQASRADRTNLVDMDVLPKHPVGRSNSNTEQSAFALTGNGMHVGEVASGMMYPAQSVAHTNWTELDTTYQGVTKG